MASVSISSSKAKESTKECLSGDISPPLLGMHLTMRTNPNDMNTPHPTTNKNTINQPNNFKTHFIQERTIDLGSRAFSWQNILQWRTKRQKAKYSRSFTKCYGWTYERRRSAQICNSASLNFTRASSSSGYLVGLSMLEPAAGQRPQNLPDGLEYEPLLQSYSSNKTHSHKQLGHSFLILIKKTKLIKNKYRPLFVTVVLYSWV